MSIALLLISLNRRSRMFHTREANQVKLGFAISIALFVIEMDANKLLGGRANKEAKVVVYKWSFCGSDSGKTVLSWCHL